MIFNTGDPFAQLANFALRTHLTSQNGVLECRHQCFLVCSNLGAEGIELGTQTVELRAQAAKVRLELAYLRRNKVLYALSIGFENVSLS